jgi:hypothetical protein
VRSRASTSKEEHMKPIHAELGDDPPGGFPEASALGITATAAAPVLALCRKLVAAGFDPNTPLEAYRDRNVIALKVRSIGGGARLAVAGNGVGFRVEASPSEGACGVVGGSLVRFAANSQPRATPDVTRLDGADIRWSKEGDEYVLRLRNGRIAARVKPEGKLWRVHFADRNRSDLMNLTRAKDAARLILVAKVAHRAAA